MRFRDQLQIELSGWEAQKEREGASAQPKLQESTIEFITKIENSWDRYVKVSWRCPELPCPALMWMRI